MEPLPAADGTQKSFQAIVCLSHVAKAKDRNNQNPSKQSTSAKSPDTYAVSRLIIFLCQFSQFS
jgi:hypothetical protein